MLLDDIQKLTVEKRTERIKLAKDRFIEFIERGIFSAANRGESTFTFHFNEYESSKLASEINCFIKEVVEVKYKDFNPKVGLGVELPLVTFSW